MSMSTGEKKVGRGFRSGLRNGLFPMLGKEMRSRTRGWRSPVLLAVFLGLLSAGTVAFLWLNLSQSNRIYPQVGLSLYSLLIFGLVFLLSFIAPALAASAISGERERRTYDLLLVTRASLTGIVLGKWLASLVYLLFLVLAALPLLGVVYLFGGVPPSAILMAVLICILTGLGYGALGLCMSAVLRRSQASTVISLVLVFLMLFGVPVVAGITAEVGPQEVPAGALPEVSGDIGPPWYLYMSPMVALVDALPDAGRINTGRSIPLISAVMNEFMQRSRSNYAREYALKMGYASGSTMAVGVAGSEEPKAVAGWPPWARFALNQGVLVLLSLGIAVTAINPRKPWQVWRAGRKARG